MRRSWILAFLFLTLWQMLPHEGYNMLYAQDMGDESYGGGYNCEDDLGQYYSSLPCENTPCFEKCMICGGQFICDEFSGHSCEEKTRCPYCDKLLTQEEFLYHNCSTQDMGCLICGRPYEYCTCEGPVITPDTPPVIPSNPPVTPSNPPVVPSYPPITPSKPSSEGGDENSGNTEENRIDSVGYHTCPCLITFTANILRNSIDNDLMLNDLNNNFPGLTEALKRHIAFPETIQQGNNGTCASALIQKYLAENYPNQYIECVYALAKSGKYEPWGLEIPANSMLSGISDYELILEDGEDNHDNMYNQGINYTAVDALMQTAIQYWADSQNLQSLMLNYFTGYTYSVIFDYGNLGGITYEDRLRFLQNIAPTNIINCSYELSNEELSEKLHTYNSDVYMIMAGVSMDKYNKDGYYFGQQENFHALEIRGMEDGYIDYWSWGKYRATVSTNNYINNLTIIKRTDYAIQEKSNRESLRCNCVECTNTHCGVCM